MSQSTHYVSFQGRFYGSDNPTNSITALKDDGETDQAQLINSEVNNVIN